MRGTEEPRNPAEAKADRWPCVFTLSKPVFHPWRPVFLLWLSLVAAGCKGGGLPRMLPGDTPHETYSQRLADAGLADTALSRDWLAAAAEALKQPRAASLPLTNDVTHVPSKPQAYGYRLDLQRGRVLNVTLTVESAEPALVFIDLFKEATTPGAPQQHIASAERDATSLAVEIEQDGSYILRIQPELLRGGTLKIGQRTTAALTFPVSGRSSDAVRSFFLDPRDNNRRDHHGIDIFAPRNTPVLAAADGFARSA